ncbi:MAG TPA: hypothetical protein VD997_08570 [Phycisphaerales bacterium]|nr:hypothetical protein [Phycisphaerales bacterium]
MTIARALPLVLLAGLCQNAHAQCEDVYRTGLPDLDQRRIDAPNKLGLPWNGASHCVPASWADNIAYISDHGLPGLLLNQSYDWTDESSYNVAGALIGYMGFLMGTDADGTSNSVSGIKQLMDERAPGALVGGAYGWTAGPAEMREVLLAGGFAALTRGFYRLQPNTFQWIRYGGHIVALRGLHEPCAVDPIVSMRDPNTDRNIESQTEQSAFRTHYEPLHKETVTFYIDGSLENREVWRYANSIGTSQVNGETWQTRRYLEGFATLIPTVALTGQPVVGEEPSGINFVRPLNLTDELNPTHTHSQLPTGTGQIKAVHVDPGLAYSWVFASGPGNTTRLIRVGMGSGESHLQYELENSLVTSYIAHTGELYVVETAPTTGAIYLRRLANPGPTAQTREHILLARQTLAIGEDDTAGRLVLLQQDSTGSYVMCRRPLELAQPEDSVQPCPPAVSLIGDIAMSVSPTTGEVLLCSSGVPAVHRISYDRVNGYQLAETIALPAGSEPRSLTWTDTGSVMLVNNGVVQEYEQDAAGSWVAKSNSLYAGTLVAPGQPFTLALTRPAADTTPSAPQSEPEDLVEGQLDHCAQDFNGDGDSGTDQDIEAFFACLGGNCCLMCGTSDYNGDGDFGTDQDIESFFRVLGGGSC